MDVLVSVPGSAELQAELRRRHVRYVPLATQRGGRLIGIVLPPVEGGYFRIVPWCHGGIWRLVTPERGGLNGRQHGEATVVCSPPGLPLFPMPDRTDHSRGWYDNYEQAWFNRQDELVEVTATGTGDTAKIAIVHFAIKCEGDLAGIEVTRIWSGRFQHLPDAQAKFRDAATAAAAKAGCHHCRDVHYQRPPGR